MTTACLPARPSGNTATDLTARPGAVTCRSRQTMAETGVPLLEHFFFLLALRITVVKQVWVWLGEGRFLQETWIFRVRGGGDGGRGVVELMHRRVHGIRDTLQGKVGRRMAWTGPDWKNLGAEVRLLIHRCPMSARGASGSRHTRQASFFRQVPKTKVPELYLVLTWD